jgi:YidC/Oxa1 family membrane protein insertase
MFQTDHKRALLAILLSGLVLFSWQYYMGPKANSTPTVQVKENETKNENNKVETKSTTENQATNTTPTAVISNFNLKTENSSYEFSSDLTLKNATNKNALVEFPFFSGSDSPIKIQLLSEQGLKDLNIAKVNSTDTHFEGRDEQNDVSFISHLNADGKLTFALNSKTPHRYRFTNFIVY